MVVDVELTLNRFGFQRIAPNKVQIGCVRLSWWTIQGKHAVSVEINWRKPSPSADAPRAARPARP
jgi:hypothetical protein